MWKVNALLVLSILLIHLYILLLTGHFDPCNAAYSKLEFDAVGTFKSKKRWIVEEDEERAKLYEYVARRDILRCYQIVLF